MQSQDPTVSRQAALAKAEVPAALSNFDQLPDSAHVGSAVVRALFGVHGATTLWKWQKAGRIPLARKLAGSRNNVWNVGELRRALAGETQKVAA